MLSKSDYREGLECGKRLWLKYHMPETEAAPSATARQRMTAGTEIGKIARNRFPGGLLIFADGDSNQMAADKTAQAMAAGADILYEATFICGSLVARIDILLREAAGWRIIEVKSSTKYKKPEHLPDVSFQAHVFTECGHMLVGASLVYINSDYVWRGGEWDVNQLFAIEDISSDVASAIGSVAVTAAGFLGLASQTAYPPDDGTAPYLDPVIQSACSGCAFVGHCKPRVPQDHVYYLGLHHTRLKKLLAEGTRSISLVPDTVPSTLPEKLRYEAFTSGGLAVSDALPERLAEIKYPAHFLDFETLRPDLPLFPGHRPYMLLPFQWSCHTLTVAPQSNQSLSSAAHSEFVHKEQSDPRAAFVQSLLQILRTGASIVHYTVYEKTVLKQMHTDGIDGSEELMSFMDRFVDLEKILGDCYVDRRFLGKTSIKYVLPVVAPKLSYASLSISNGDQAQLEYLRLLNGEVNDDDAKQLVADLLAYCKLDTQAMLEVLNALVSAA